MILPSRCRSRFGPAHVVLVLAALLSGAVSARSATLHVPEDYATIQAAIDASGPGDSVAVGPGTWTAEVRNVSACGNAAPIQAVLFLKPGVTVLSTVGAEQTILDGGVQGQFAVNTIFMGNATGPEVRVDGFTVTGGGDALEMGCCEALVVLSDCWLIDNWDNAIATTSCRLRLEGCVVARNGFGSDGDGRAVEAFSSDLEIVRTRFEENASTALLVQGPSATLSVMDSEFVDHANGRAVSLSVVPEAVFSRSLFARNRVRASAVDGGAIGVFSSNADVSFCTFAMDSAVAGNGGAIIVGSESTASINDNTFFGCSASFGAAVMVAGQASIARNVIAGSAGRALVASSVAQIVTEESGCNVLWNDTNYFQWPAEASSTDILADPEFCDPLVGDYSVRSSSPCLPENNAGCGPIGAHGAGCGTVSVEATTFGRIKALYRDRSR